MRFFARCRCMCLCYWLAKDKHVGISFHARTSLDTHFSRNERWIVINFIRFVKQRWTSPTITTISTRTTTVYRSINICSTVLLTEPTAIEITNALSRRFDFVLTIAARPCIYLHGLPIDFISNLDKEQPIYVFKYAQDDRCQCESTNADHMGWSVWYRSMFIFGRCSMLETAHGNFISQFSLSFWVAFWWNDDTQPMSSDSITRYSIRPHWSRQWPLFILQRPSPTVMPSLFQHSITI